MAPKQKSDHFIPRMILIIVIIAVGLGSPLYILWERNGSPVKLEPLPMFQPAIEVSTFSPPKNNNIKVMLQSEENETSRALWRHLVDCTAAMSNLCDLSRYEFAKSGFWQKKCTTTTPTTLIDFDSSSILAHRRRLRTLVEGRPVASPLTGYHTPSVPIRSLSKSDQIGCDGTKYQKTIEQIVKKWNLSGKRMPLGFTMTDSKYMDLLEDQYWVAINIVGLDNFFVAAYDSESVSHTCGLGIDVVVPVEVATLSTLRVRTAISKFKVAQSLALLNVVFLFWEMDVFIFKTPYPILMALSDTNVDIVVSAHQVNVLSH